MQSTPGSSLGLRLALCAAGAVVALALAACGGGGSGVLSVEEWVERSNEMCARQQEQWEAWQQELVSVAGDVEAAAQIFERSHPEIEAMMEEAEEMGPPEGHEERYARSLEDDARILELYGELPAALRARDETRMQRMDEELASLAKRNSDFTRDLGAHECAVPEE